MTRYLAMSALLSQINNTAHQGAFGNNPSPEPTLAQLEAGNYKKGHITLHGLDIAIENPAYTYRKGMDKTGQKWTCLMQAHYGYIKGYKGNDGDELDVFVGHVPENDTVYIINQKSQGGYFDEHKIMLGFLSQQQAVDTYQHCFERGWTGLMSVVPCTMNQFKWWLANGDKSRPVTRERLPYAGLERLDSVIWGGNDGTDLASHSGHVHNLMYQIRQSDDIHQALEPLSYKDMVQELGNQGFVYENYDALVVEHNKLERKAKQLLMVMQGAASTVKPVGVAISKPLTKGGVANVVVWFEMDDGQAVGVFFHNPDKTPKKIDPTDEMISYKWVLNKKDITIAVAPENGKDLIIRTVAKRIMQLVEKNHDRFMKANNDKAELNQKEQDLTAQVAEKQSILKGLQDEIDALQAKKVEQASVQKQQNPLAQQPELVTLTGKELGDFPDTPEGKKALRAAAKAEFEKLLGQWVDCPALSGKVELRKSGMKKVLSLSADSKKLEIIPMLKSLISSAIKIDSVQSNDILSEQNIKAYHILRSKVMLDNVLLAVRLVIREDDKGQYHYDHAITESVAEKLQIEKSPSEDRLDSVTTTNGRGVADESVKPTHIARHQLDSILDSGAWVVNLFIEGEPAEVIAEEDAPDDAQERPENWRTNLAHARAVANKLGIETKNKNLEKLVKAIDENDNAGTQQQVSKPKKASVGEAQDAYDTLDYSLTDLLGHRADEFKEANVVGRLQPKIDAIRALLERGVRADWAERLSALVKKADGMIDSWHLANAEKPDTTPTIPITPTQEDQDREFLQSAIDEKIDILDTANVNRLAELSKVYTQGDMNGLIKQAKQVAIDAVKRSIANVTAKIN